DKKAEIVILYAQKASVPVKSVTLSAKPQITRLPETRVLKPPVALLRQHGEIRMPDNARALVDGVYEQKIAAPAGLQTISDVAFG
ncbi:hypothetical protein MJL79_29895, partial [Salmonella enterica subsp. enterica serovar Montevideo]|nr:hypothetical protein [Salmonella enterica subsp. enterica serovar Montevideo]